MPGMLPIRVHAGVRADGLENALERGLRSGARIGEADPTRLAFGWLKLFADGTLGSRTAALLSRARAPPSAACSLTRRSSWPSER